MQLQTRGRSGTDFPSSRNCACASVLLDNGLISASSCSRVGIPYWVAFSDCQRSKRAKPWPTFCGGCRMFVLCCFHVNVLPCDGRIKPNGISIDGRHRLTTSKIELECNLTDARVASDRDDSKARAWNSCTALSRSTRDTGACAGRAQAAGCYKLRVIECIEKLGAKFDMHAVTHREVFQKRHIPVVDSWASKEASPRISQLAQLL
jgi:hypothetical protein